jgi:hypothetical protein
MHERAGFVPGLGSICRRSKACEAYPTEYSCCLAIYQTSGRCWMTQIDSLRSFGDRANAIMGQVGVKIRPRSRS